MAPERGSLTQIELKSVILEGHTKQFDVVVAVCYTNFNYSFVRKFQHGVAHHFIISSSIAFVVDGQKGESHNKRKKKEVLERENEVH